MCNFHLPLVAWNCMLAKRCLISDKGTHRAKISKIFFSGLIFELPSSVKSFRRASLTASLAISRSSVIARFMILVFSKMGIFPLRGNSPHFISSGRIISSSCAIRQSGPWSIASKLVPNAMSPMKSSDKRMFNDEMSIELLDCAARSSCLT